jgi:small subunit ribosomal protein S5
MANYSAGFEKKGSSEDSSFREVVVFVNRVTKVVKGGKRMSFNTVVVVGDGNGRVGCSLGKAKEVQAAIQKASGKAKKNMITVPVTGTTIPHEIVGRCGASRVLLRPASPGTGIIASDSVRSVVESCGIKDILTKCIDSKNPLNVVYATMDGLSRLRTREYVMKLRGKNATQ